VATHGWTISLVEDCHMASYKWGWTLSGRRCVDRNIRGA